MVIFKYRQFQQCKSCGKIYPKGRPKICYKCGAELGGLICVKNYNWKYSVARKILFWWEVKPDENT